MHLDAQMMDMDEDHLYEAKHDDKATRPCAEEPASMNFEAPKFLMRRTMNSENDLSDMLETPKSLGPIPDAFSIPDNMSDGEKAELAELLKQIQTMELRCNPQLFQGPMHLLSKEVPLPIILVSHVSGRSQFRQRLPLRRSQALVCCYNAWQDLYLWTWGRARGLPISCHSLPVAEMKKSWQYQGNACFLEGADSTVYTQNPVEAACKGWVILSSNIHGWIDCQSSVSQYCHAG